MEKLSIKCLKAYQRWMEEKSKDLDVEMYLTTIMFKHLGRLRQENALDIIRKEVEIFAGGLFKRLHRNPKSVLLVKQNFCIVFFPDLPVHKTTSDGRKINSRFLQVNNGLHVHGIALIPKVSRLKGENLIDHIKSKQKIYCPTCGKIQNIHVEKITDAENATAYAAKHFYRETFNIGDVIIVPKARSEM